MTSTLGFHPTSAFCHCKQWDSSSSSSTERRLANLFHARKADQPKEWETWLQAIFNYPVKRDYLYIPMRYKQWRWWNEVSNIPLSLSYSFSFSRLLTISSTVVLALGEPTTSNWELGACGNSWLWLRSNEPPDARWESGGADERYAASGYLPVRETHLIIFRLLTLLCIDLSCIILW